MTEHVPTATPNTPDSEQALRVVLVDQSQDAHDEARDSADARLDRELGEGVKIKQFLNGVWKGNLAKDYYRQKYVSQALETIQETNNVLVEAPAERRTRALESTINRFSSDYEELIHTDAGERREVQDETSPLARGVKRLVHDFVEGRLNATTLHEERTRLLNEYRREHGEEAMGKGIVTTDNILSIAQTVAGAVEHGESLDHALGRLEVVTGEARNGARTEARYTAADKAVDWLSKRKIASFVTPSVLATGIAAGMAITRVTGHGVVGAVTKTLIPGVAAGAWAALRENKRTKDERAQHSREMAVGETFEEGDKRREAMEATRYESVSAVDLMTELQNAGSTETLDQGGTEALQAALDALAAAQARVELSDSKNIDLISYSSKADVGEERMMLDLARREARLTVEERLTAEARAALNLGPQASVKGLINQRARLFATVLTEGDEEHEGIEDKDAAFAKLKRKRVATAAAVGVATGIIGGLVVQEAVAAFDPTRFGLIDAIRGDTPELYNGEVHQTILEGFARGDETTVHTGPSTTYESYATTGTGTLELSDDHSMITNEDGTFNLVDPSGAATVEGLAADANGTLDEASLEKLEAAGMVVEDTSYDELVQTTTTEQVATDQYIQHHLAETTAVTRDLWYGNDTSAYDQNELRVYRGGSESAPGIIDGGYQYTVAGMTEDGSYQNGESVSWSQAAANGNLFVAVSGTFDSQGNPFMIPIGPDGAVNIPADSPAGQFFANENNSVAFNGAYMEIVQTTGADAEGVTHIRPLATLVGDGSVETVNDTVVTESTVHHAEYKITSNGFDTVQQNATEVAAITPIPMSRRSMEALKNEGAEGSTEVPPPTEEAIPEAPRNTYAYGEYQPTSREEFSPRLRDSPEAQLDLREELGWYRGELARRDGEDYANEIQQLVDTTPELSADLQGIRTVVTVPVAAAYESENIYGTLSLYAQQDKEQLSRNLVVMNVNWLDVAEQNPENMQAVQKTLAEIERAKKDFPDLRVAAFTKQYEAEEVKKTGGVIGYVASDLMNVALLTLNKYASQNPGTDIEDVAIIRQDADMEGMSRHYLQNVEKAFDTTDADIYNGTIRSSVRMQKRYPGLGIITNFSQSLNAVRTQQNQPWTVGINMVVRASTLAAAGGLGERGHYSGPGSDDVQVGWRIEAARRASGLPTITPSYSNGSQPLPKREGRKIVTHVAGITVDSSALRLIPQYLLGRHFGAAWDAEASGSGAFSAGPGGYLSRDEFALDVMRQNPKDIIDDDHLYKFIDTNMSAELVNSGRDDPDGKKVSEGVIKKTLAVFFGNVPGAYVIHGELGSRDVRFELTEEGKTFIKNRLQRETNGTFGSYGLRKMRQQYGVTSGVRRPAAVESPLVSPLI